MPFAFGDASRSSRSPPPPSGRPRAPGPHSATQTRTRLQNQGVRGSALARAGRVVAYISGGAVVGAAGVVLLIGGLPNNSGGYPYGPSDTRVEQSESPRAPAIESTPTTSSDQSLREARSDAEAIIENVTIWAANGWMYGPSPLIPAEVARHGAEIEGREREVIELLKSWGERNFIDPLSIAQLVATYQDSIATCGPVPNFYC